jgi:hypothetical protein
MTPEAQLSTRRVFSGRVINLDVDLVRYPDGSEGELDREQVPLYHSSATRLETIRRCC